MLIIKIDLVNEITEMRHLKMSSATQNENISNLKACKNMCTIKVLGTFNYCKKFKIKFFLKLYLQTKLKGGCKSV